MMKKILPNCPTSMVIAVLLSSLPPALFYFLQFTRTHKLSVKKMEKKRRTLRRTHQGVSEDSEYRITE
jgi:hypothetical protein